MTELALWVDEAGAPTYVVTGVVTDFIHIVGYFQNLLDRVGLKVPRALCGVSLADPNVLGYDTRDGDSSFCPVCAQITGWAWCSMHGDYEPGEVCSDIPDEVPYLEDCMEGEI